MRYDDDTDPWMELEALEDSRRDADLEMAEMARAGDAIHAARQAGRCCHTSAAGYISPPVYPEQQGLRPGQVACTEHTGGCTAVFSSDDDWVAALDQAISL